LGGCFLGIALILSQKQLTCQCDPDEKMPGLCTFLRKSLFDLFQYTMRKYTYTIPLLQNDYFFPCTGQVTRCNQPIVSSANNDSIDLPGLIRHENKAPFWNATKVRLF